MLHFPFRHFLLPPLLLALARPAAAEVWTNAIPDGVAPDTYAEFSLPRTDDHASIRLHATGTPGVVVKLSDKPRVAIEDGAPLRSEDISSSSLPSLAGNAESVLLSLRRYRERCTLYVDGQPAAAFPDPWAGAVQIELPREALAKDTAPDPFVQELGAFTFKDAFMVADKDQTALQNWETLSGDWGLHAVTGRTVHAEDPREVARWKLTRFPIPSQSPNFYSLNGSGKDAVILAGESFHSHYAVQAAVQHSLGTNGIAFLATDAPSCFTFAAETTADNRILFALRKGCVPGVSPGELVMGAVTECTPGQWYLLEVRVGEEEVTCLVDHSKLFSCKLPLPAGGRYGLYTSSSPATPARFDDFTAATWTDALPSDFAGQATPGAKIKGNRLELDRSIQGAEFFQDMTEHAVVARAPFELRYGCTNDPPPCVQQVVDLPAPGGSAELAIGIDGADAAPAYRLRLTRNGGTATAELFRHDDSNKIDLVLDTCTIPVGSTNGIVFPCILCLDATTPGILAGRVNDKALVLAGISDRPAGAVALSARGEDTAVSPPVVLHAPSPYTDLFEKNKLYVTDPFMRHWASTAGQWLTYTNGASWFKDDVLGRFSLSFPPIDGLDLRLAVPERSSEGAFRIVCTNATLTLFPAGATNPVFTTAYTAATVLDPSTAPSKNDGLSFTNAPLTLHLDGRRLLLSCPTGHLFTCEAPCPAPGRRMFFAKAPVNYLGHVIVLRSSVLDCLFSESLHDWTVNGGRWEVINRFQCLPTWSHMDGENHYSLAALWSKYEIGGEFAATFIAGMRHGWYDRVGDFNLTLFNSANSASDGYTLTVTGWDPDHSQRWTTLYRDGVPLARSDAHAAPRNREGNRRIGYEPLVSKGRDVHGAWYTIHLRRLGNRLEMLFDNLPVLAADDPTPPASGRFGIWTYQNSMVVARVRITADMIRPRRPASMVLTADEIIRLQARRHEPPAEASRHPLTFNGLPADLLQPALWHSGDTVSFPHIDFRREDDETTMRVTSTLGAGSFLAACEAPEVLGSRLAGWQFEVARSEGARFNFEYEIITEKPVTNAYTHILCGETNALGARIIGGVSPVPAPTARDAKSPVWTPVTVWLPPIGEPPAHTTVRAIGFGNLQSGPVQQGLCGNKPGDWYAIRRMRPIYRGVPIPENDSQNAAAFEKGIAEALARGRAGELNLHKVHRKIDPDSPTIAWTLPPADSQGIIASVIRGPAPSIVIRSTLPWPNPLLCATNVTIDGVRIENASLRDGEILVPVPRPFRPAAANIRLSILTAGGRPFTQFIPATAFEGPASAPPVLVSLVFPEGLPASYMNFESQTNTASPYYMQNHQAMVSVLGGNEPQGSYLHVANQGVSRRLSARLAQAYDFARSPLLQFRYRGDAMAHVQILPSQKGHYGFSPLPPPPSFIIPPPPNAGASFPTNPAIPSKANPHLPPYATGILDGAWHTALCPIGSRVAPMEIPLASLASLRPGSLQMGSLPGAGTYGDQSGLYSTFDLDDIAIGPAIGPTTTNFAFRAVFDGLGKNGTAEYALSAQDDPYDLLSEEARKALAWTAFPHGTDDWVRPGLASVTNREGIVHLLIRATSSEGVPSRVADIPFLYDSKPPAATFSVRATIPPKAGDTTPRPHQKHNGTQLVLQVKGNGGTPPTLDGLSFSADGKTMRFPASYAGSVQTEGDTVDVNINWPFVLRDRIQEMTNGTEIAVTASGIADGAGNRAPDLSTSIRLDYGSDTNPPTIFHPSHRIACGELHLSAYNSTFQKLGRGVAFSFTPTNRMRYATYGNNGKSPDRFVGAFFNQRPWHPETNRWLLIKARVPAKANLPPPGKPVFTLVFKSGDSDTPDDKGNGKMKTCSLDIFAVTNAPFHSSVSNLYGRLAFTPGEWTDIAVDVAGLIRAQTGDPHAFTVRRAFLKLPDNKAAKIDIATFVVVGDRKEKQTADWNAYDASGIDGVYLGDVKIADGWKIKPFDTELPSPDIFLPDLRIRDRAGNASVPLTLVPFPPRVP